MNKKPIGKVGENRYKFTKTNNIEKLENEIKIIHRRLKIIHLNHIHQVTREIVKTKPSRIVVEDLNITEFYPSSKMCSCCGEIKKNLNLKDRVFICPSCDFKFDRDKNASINLSRYRKSA